MKIPIHVLLDKLGIKNLTIKTKKDYLRVKEQLKKLREGMGVTGGKEVDKETMKDIKKWHDDANR